MRTSTEQLLERCAPRCPWLSRPDSHLLATHQSTRGARRCPPTRVGPPDSPGPPRPPRPGRSPGLLSAPPTAIAQAAPHHKGRGGCAVHLHASPRRAQREAQAPERSPRACAARACSGCARPPPAPRGPRPPLRRNLRWAAADCALARRTPWRPLLPAQSQRPCVVAHRMGCTAGGQGPTAPRLHHRHDLEIQAGMARPTRNLDVDKVYRLRGRRAYKLVHSVSQGAVLGAAACLLCLAVRLVRRVLQRGEQRPGDAFFVWHHRASAIGRLLVLLAGSADALDISRHSVHLPAQEHTMSERNFDRDMVAPWLCACLCPIARVHPCNPTRWGVPFCALWDVFYSDKGFRKRRSQERGRKLHQTRLSSYNMWRLVLYMALFVQLEHAPRGFGGATNEGTCR